MKKLFLPLVAVVLTACSTTVKEANYQVVPLPNSISLETDAPYTLSKSTLIAYPEGNEPMKRNAEFLSDYIARATGYTLKTRAYTDSKLPADAIVLELDSSVQGAEAYQLTVNPGGIILEASTPRGIFYGIQTLRKSIPAVATGAKISFPAVNIADAPRFEYRGMHLDVARHFFPVEFVKEYIDLLALHNINTFHWHITDDQGWRIEIKRYPELTEKGSVRDSTVVGKYNSGKYDRTPYGGFYTQEEAKEIVDYAAKRYITVIPEVDLPGHMLAALACFPELGCTGGPYSVCADWGVMPDVLCIGNPKTFEFLHNVLDEIIRIFPSEYIHIGGDEAPRIRWKACPKCQALIRKLGLKADAKHTAEDRLQSYCMTDIQNYLAAKGRSIIGWDEILEGDIAAGATVMSWRGSKGGIAAAQLGHDVIMTPNNFCYFDYFQVEDPKDEPLGIGGFVPLEKVYSFEPTAELTPQQAAHILGPQANLWTEYIATPEHVEYNVLPRMAALGEVGWTQPDLKEYSLFFDRLQRLKQFYDRDSLNYCRYEFIQHAPQQQ
ncbi:MAG: beta-N-acetylhexosaminidase [Prevotellaceae bacterium]|jgi:hexosaminidase|nr:beta-N-acetylhexosaminidase [Prevotellaceae bacterium]